MKTPVKSEKHYTHEDTGMLHEHYQELSKNNKKDVEIKRNLLLTPFLLSIPVITILFILISGSASDFSSTVNTEPVQPEIVTNAVKKERTITTPVIRTDSTIISKSLQ